MTVEPEIIGNYVESGQVRLVFKPVLDHNPASQIATEAAYCAGEQDPALFWEMHNVLFSQQTEFGAATDKVAQATEYAGTLDLELTAFQSCLSEHRYAEQIVAQDQARRAEGIRQRPSFHITGPGRPEGLPAPGAQPFGSFQKLIAEAAGG